MIWLEITAACVAVVITLDALAVSILSLLTIQNNARVTLYILNKKVFEGQGRVATYFIATATLVVAAIFSACIAYLVGAN